MLSKAQFVEQRPIWLFLFLSAFALETTALIFQHVFGLEPCVKCIYSRVATTGLLFSGLIVLINPKWLVLRLIGYLGLIISSAWGVKISYDHVVMLEELNPLFAVCDTIPDFPAWFQPHVWLPELFEVRGSCTDQSWTLFDINMPQWMKLIFSIYLIVAMLVISYRLFAVRKL